MVPSHVTYRARQGRVASEPVRAGARPLHQKGHLLKHSGSRPTTHALCGKTVRWPVRQSGSAVLLRSQYLRLRGRAHLVTDGGWFSGDEPRTDDEARFLARLRELAPDWPVAGLVPDGTWCSTGMVPLFVAVDCPSLAGEVGLTSLHVGYWPPTGHGLRLQGEWGDAYLLDNGGDDTDLHIQGVPAKPEFFADAAGTWLATQLLRPINRLEWVKGNRVVAMRVQLGDAGKTLVRRGSSLRTRRRPDATIRLN